MGLITLKISPLKTTRWGAAICVAAALLLAATTAPNPATAAGNGRLGASSSGSIALRAFVPNSFRVRGVQGVTVDEFDGPKISDDGRVCVHSNMNEAYTVQATFKTGRFALVDGAAAAGVTPLPPTATPVAFTPATGNGLFCRRGTVLTIKSQDGGPADPNAAFLKTGTVIMTVVPE